MRLDELPAYALFALVVRHQSFSRAAAQAGVARSVASDRVRRLEARLGTQLLRRTTRRVTPTEAGLRLHAACAPLLEQAERLGRGAGAVAPAGPVRVEAPLQLVAAGLGALLTGLVAGRPGLALELSVGSRPVDLLETRADVVLRVGRALPPDTVARRLGRTRLVLVGAPAYLRRAGTPEEPQQLLRHACLHYLPTPLEQEWRFEGRGGAYPVPVAPRLATDDGGLLKGWALEGLGLAVLPAFMVARELEAGTLRRLLPSLEGGALDCWAILPAGRLAPRDARWLVDQLGRRLGAAVPGLGGR